jgi:hypothetical protein
VLAVATGTASGIFWIEPDGTIVLDLRRTSDGINVDIPPQRIGSSDPSYRKILKAVGPLQPGETRSVMPWSEERLDSRPIVRPGQQRSPEASTGWRNLGLH